MEYTDDLTNLTKEELIALVQESQKSKPKKLPSKRELFDIVMDTLESQHGNVPMDIIIDELVKTGRFSIVQARKCLSDASQAGYVIEAESGSYRRVSTHV